MQSFDTMAPPQTNAEKINDFSKSLPTVRHDSAPGVLHITKAAPMEMVPMGYDYRLNMSVRVNSSGEMRGILLTVKPDDIYPLDEKKMHHYVYGFVKRGPDSPPQVLRVSLTAEQTRKLQSRQLLSHPDLFVGNQLEQVLGPGLVIEEIPYENSNKVDGVGPERHKYELGREFNGALDALLPPTNPGLGGALERQGPIKGVDGHHAAETLKQLRVQRGNGPNYPDSEPFYKDLMPQVGQLYK